MNDVITLCFRYTEEDYVQAMQSHYAQRTRLTLDLAVICVTTASGVYLLREPDERILGVACLGVAVVFGLMLLAAFLIIPRLIFRREPKLHDEYTLEFTSTVIHFRTAHIDSRLQWSLYSSALIGANSYVLYYGKRSISVIPQRVFRDIQEREQFEQLLREKIPKIVHSWK